VNERGNSVSRIDPSTGKVVGDEIRVGSTPVGIASGGGSIWVANNGDDTVSRIDP
jgi:serine/threonine-protein kinase